MTESTGDLVKVHFELPESEFCVGGESLWASPLGNNLYELRNSPWHARTVNWLDVVEAVAANENQWPEFVKVHRRSGHRTVHIYFLETDDQQKRAILDNCNALGSTYEEGINRKLYSLDFPPSIEIEPSIEYFESLKREGILDWRINDFD